ncbi:hypothetical protein GBA52_025346 [Prunus armeniaca]|nr:hypothetical protein GBA52_025346 [Prunus armeniaca]
MSNSTSSDLAFPNPTLSSHSSHSHNQNIVLIFIIMAPQLFLIFSVLCPLAIALLIYQLDLLDPAPLPSTRSEFVGAGALVAPEDVAYDSKSGLIYTGCADGWVKRVTLNELAADYLWWRTGFSPVEGRLDSLIAIRTRVFVADTEKEVTPYWDLALRYPFIRKVLAIVKWYAAGRPHMEKNAGVLAVNLNGEPTAHYSDPEEIKQ